jgi:hypothetical protein
METLVIELSRLRQGYKNNFFVLVLTAFMFSTIYANPSAAFSCRIVDQILLQADQGESIRYNNIKGGYQTGSLMRFEINLESLMTQDPIPFLSISSNHVNTDGQFFYWSSPLSRIDLFGEQVVAPGLNWSSNYLRIGGAGGFLSIERYYMSDWHGSLSVSFASTLTYTAILNCIGASDSLDSARLRLLEYPGIEVRQMPRVEDIPMAED